MGEEKEGEGCAEEKGVGGKDQGESLGREERSRRAGGIV